MGLVRGRDRRGEPDASRGVGIGVADRIAVAGCDFACLQWRLGIDAQQPPVVVAAFASGSRAAVALPAITTRTDSEKRIAFRVKAPPQAKAFNRLIRYHGAGHFSPQ